MNRKIEVLNDAELSQVIGGSSYLTGLKDYITICPCGPNKGKPRFHFVNGNGTAYTGATDEFFNKLINKAQRDNGIILISNDGKTRMRFSAEDLRKFL